MFDDQVMDSIVEALHQSHADEKRFREDAITRLQDEQSKIQNGLDSFHTLIATVRQPFDLLAIYEHNLAKKKGRTSWLKSGFDVIRISPASN